VNKTLKCAQRELSRHKGRTFSNIFGYFLAIGVMVILGHLFLFSDLAIRAIMEGTGIHFMAFIPAKAEDATNPAPQTDDKRISIKVPIDFQNEGFLANTIPTRVLSQEALKELRQYPNLIKDASPYLMFRIREGNTGNVFSIGGFDPTNKQAVGSTCCAKGDLIKGEFLRPQDKGMAMLEQGFAQGRELKIGDSITIGDESFKIKGIINPGVRPAKADVYLPFQDAERIINKRLRTPLADEMNVVLIEVAGASKQDAAIEKVKEILKAGIVTSYACYKPASQVAGINRNTAILLSLLVGLGAMLFSMKSQYASIIERRRDFGILKAIGWPNSSIFQQVMLESLLQALVGSILGCILGATIIFTLPIRSWLGQNTSSFISVQILGLGLLLSVVAGLIAGFVPAYSAASERPLKNLRQL